MQLGQGSPYSLLNMYQGDTFCGEYIICLESCYVGVMDRQVSFAGHRSQVTGHCFANTESIPNTCKS